MSLYLCYFIKTDPSISDVYISLSEFVWIHYYIKSRFEVHTFPDLTLV